MQRIIALWNRSLFGKAIVGLVGLLLACCVIGVFAPRQPQTAAPAVQAPSTGAVQPTRTPKPTEPPAATRAPRVPSATQTPEPPAPTSEPTDAPQLTAAALVPAKATEVPTSAPAPAAKPTAASQPAASGPTYHGSGGSQTVDPPWWPCQKEQIKGNRNSGIYHVPTGRSYAKTFKDVAWFNTAAEAEAAGFRAAKN